MEAGLDNAKNREGRVKLGVSRFLAYLFLGLITAICLFSFYLLVINATRSNAQLQAGFTLYPQNNFLNNLRDAWTDASINIPRGMLNSFIVAAGCSVLTTYFSALTAYGIHAYEFKRKRFAFYFIMAVMMIPMITMTMTTPRAYSTVAMPRSRNREARWAR